MVTISLCMIVKNEERVLGRCLESVQEIADEIIIVDTGSEDRTKKIAEKYHADFLALQDMIILKAEKAGYESVTTDGIHLTEYGNEIIAGAWLQLFEKIKDGD